MLDCPILNIIEVVLSSHICITFALHNWYSFRKLLKELLLPRSLPELSPLCRAAPRSSHLLDVAERHRPAVPKYSVPCNLNHLFNDTSIIVRSEKDL